MVSIYCLLALGLNIVVGYAGLLDLGYVGFYAIGAYTAAILTSFHANWPLLLAIPVAVLATTISGVMLGAPTLRVRGDYLAIVTLGFGEIIRLTADQPRMARRQPGHLQHQASAEPGPLRDPAPQLGRRHPAARLQRHHEVRRVRRARPDPLLLARPDRRHHRAVRRPPDQGQPRRPRLGGHPRGRGRRRADGRPDVQVQAARLRHRAPFIGGLAGALYASRQSFINPTVVPAAVLDPVPGRRSWSVAGQPVGRAGRRHPGGLPARAVPRVRRLPGARVRRWP